jgi:OmpA-OmpF porin, OOP family
MKLLFLYSSLFLILNTQISGQIHDTSISFSNVLEDSIFNYLRNPSFEEFNNCPTRENKLQYCNYWNKLKVRGSYFDSPDYFHRCSNYYMGGFTPMPGIPVNFAGNQEPNSGNAYVGIIAYNENGYREYIQTRLKSPLKEDTSYMVFMHVSLAERSKYSSDRFSFCFTKDSTLEYSQKNKRQYVTYDIFCHESVTYKSHEHITDTINWVRLESEFIAKGGEIYLTIGVFANDFKWWEKILKKRRVFNPNWENTKYPIRGAYYFIDDIYVIRKEDYLKMKQYDEIE